MLVEAVEDGAVGGVDRGDARGVGADVAEGGAGDQEPAVGVGLGHHRAEVPVADGELPGHGVVEGQVVAVPVAHGGPLHPLTKPLLVPSSQQMWDAFHDWLMSESLSPQVLGLWNERTKPPAGSGL